jgi:uncharacterized membrane protein YedE/YeeE
MTFVVGVVFGIALNRIGFTSWDEVHNMFTFADLRLTLTFAVAVAFLVGSWWGFQRTGRQVGINRKIHKGTIAGGILFGVGWALSGACPSIGLVQLGEGQLGALWTLGGIFVGNAIYAWVHPRYFGWSTGSCLDE